jgi:hypothetical protein
LGTLWDQEECNQFCSKEELRDAARDEEMKIPWQETNEGPPVPEDQYQERSWRRRLDGIGLDTATKEFLAIEFKRTQDARIDYVERATAGAQGQYKSLLTGPDAHFAAPPLTSCTRASDANPCAILFPPSPPPPLPPPPPPGR